MFGLGAAKATRVLQKSFSECFSPLKDELGNVPVEMQTSKDINARMLGICEAYAHKRKVSGRKQLATIVDAVFEEVYRRDAITVLTRVDQWLGSQDAEFMPIYEQMKTQIEQQPMNEAGPDVRELRDYAVNHFEPSKTIMV